MRNILIGLAVLVSVGWAQLKDTSPRTLGSLTYTALMARTDPNGTVAFCKDCAPSTPLAAGGSGVTVVRENGRWVTKQTFLAINVMDFGARGDGSIDDTPAIRDAITAACATPAPRVVFPAPPVAYKVITTLNLCSKIDVSGYGHPTINYTGTGALFQFVGPGSLYQPTIHGLFLLGNHTAGQIGILLSGWAGGGSAAFNVHIYDLRILGFGDPATHNGAGIELVSTDSASMTIEDTELVNDGDDFSMVGSTADGLNYSNNHLGGSGYCFHLEGAAGAGAMRVSHNVMTCGKGGVRFNPASGFGTFDHNEFEATGAITDPDGAVFNFQGGFSYVSDNLISSHGYALYDFYVGNSVYYSSFFNNTGGVSTTNMFYVGTGTYNNYFVNSNFLGGTGATPVYSNPAYVGIIVGAPQTPWASDIEAALHNLNDVGGLGVGAGALAAYRVFVYAAGGGAIVYPVLIETSNMNQYGLIHLEADSSAFAGLAVINDLGASGGITIGGSTNANANIRGNTSVTATHDLILQAGGVEHVHILGANGFVGILKPNPLTALDVNGVVTATGFHGGIIVPTNCTLQPSGTLWNNGGVAAFCP